MGTALGLLLLAVPALYAAVWAWLRAGLRSQGGPAPPAAAGLAPPTGPAPAAGKVVGQPATAPTSADEVVGHLTAMPTAVNGLVGQPTSLPTAVDGPARHPTAMPTAVNGLVGQPTYAPAPADGLAGRPTAAPPAAGGLVGHPAPVPAPLFSVLIAARDEAAALPRLLAALRAQTIPPAQFEVFIIDDHSTDGTAALVLAATASVPFALRLLRLPPGTTGKKAALAAAEAQARAPWVVATDADCRPAPGWLAAYAALLARQPGLHFVSGPVRLTPGGAWFDGLLGLEFAGLVGVGAEAEVKGQCTPGQPSLDPCTTAHS